MFPGDIIKGNFRIDRLYSDEGGMGAILLVHDLHNDSGPWALKYCKESTDEFQKRFRREARLMNEFIGNQKVVQLKHLDLEHEPPYIVMPFYADGDIRTYNPVIETDFHLQESIFLQMIDCINELHTRNIFHRDIKPQNFLRTSSGIVISDFGLSIESSSQTLFTTPSQYWGTQGYTPPEFLAQGGFQNASAESDIFMLGKSFYFLATGRDSTFINESILSKPLAGVINKCCKIDPVDRYQTLAELRQALVAAFDVILKRSDIRHESVFLLDEIQEQIRTQKNYNPDKVSHFIERFLTLDVSHQWALISTFQESLFVILAGPSFTKQLLGFLLEYEEAVMSNAFEFSYAEVVADAMGVIFKLSKDNAARAKAFEIAVRMAAHMSRYAAMDTCVAMAASIHYNDSIGADIATIILKYPEEFLKSIEIVNLQNNDVRLAVSAINKN